MWVWYFVVMHFSRFLPGFAKNDLLLSQTIWGISGGDVFPIFLWGSPIFVEEFPIEKPQLGGFRNALFDCAQTSHPPRPPSGGWLASTDLRYVPDLLPKLQSEPECICGVSSSAAGPGHLLVR